VRTQKLYLVVMITLIAALTIWLNQQTRVPTSQADSVSLAAVMSDSDEANPNQSRFKRVTGPVELRFPDDHARHDDFQNEWWYFTGNLEGDDGRRFGFQYTLFRFHLGSTADVVSDADQVPNKSTASAWDSEQMWMAHFAISDLDSERFYSEERFARDALALAGATSQRWWLGSWEVVASDNGWKLQALAESMGLELQLVPSRSKVLQGEQGYSRKGPKPGQASHYYSHTRLDVSGRLEVDGWSGQVKGLAWLDREWGSGQLDASQTGWDWFALHFDDGRDLMVFQLRGLDGQPSGFASGSLVWPDGHYQILSGNDFTMQPGRRWRDELGVEWPMSWSIDLPQHDIAITVEAAFDNQRWRASVPYWEGMVDIINQNNGAEIGRGYMELSGYADSTKANQ